MWKMVDYHDSPSLLQYRRTVQIIPKHSSFISESFSGWRPKMHKLWCNRPGQLHVWGLSMFSEINTIESSKQKARKDSSFGWLGKYPDCILFLQTSGTKAAAVVCKLPCIFITETVWITMSEDHFGDSTGDLKYWHTTRNYVRRQTTSGPSIESPAPFLSPYPPTTLGITGVVKARIMLIRYLTHGYIYIYMTYIMMCIYIYTYIHVSILYTHLQ